MKKYFIITIDTEGDSLWDNDAEITTKNVAFLPRFQELCEKYSFIPVWLTNWEMVNDESFVKYFKEKQDNKLCEIGMHLHAWNNPPLYKLEAKTKERSYLYEYPYEIMEEKIKTLSEKLEECFGVKPVSHRAGRWAMDKNYFTLLKKYGYTNDCSVTPGNNWENNLGQTGKGGTDYSNFQNKIDIVDGILEMPVTIRNIRCFQSKRISSLYTFLREVKDFIKSKQQWIRPDKYCSSKGLKKVVRECYKSSCDYAMFMIHSSELMPNGSPSFVSEEDIENLYICIEDVFKYAKKLGFEGISLRDFTEIKKNEFTK